MKTACTHDSIPKFILLSQSSATTTSELGRGVKMFFPRPIFLASSLSLPVPGKAAALKLKQFHPSPLFKSFSTIKHISNNRSNHNINTTIIKASRQFISKMPQSVGVVAAPGLVNGLEQNKVRREIVINGQEEIGGLLENFSAATALTINPYTNSTSPLKAKTIITGNGSVVTNGIYQTKNFNRDGTVSCNGVKRMSRSSTGGSSGGGTPSPPNGLTTGGAKGSGSSRSMESFGLETTVDGSISDRLMRRTKKIYKIVLTGGPCGGKTTGQARLCTFFENLGWKVFRVPEAANILLGGGVKFSELSEDQAFRFQEDLLRTMMQIESVFFALAETIDQDVLVICDRGAMDASAFIPREKWEEILKNNNWNEVDIRDTRYNQIIHMVSAANGAEAFYTLDDHTSRSESLDLARILDQKAAQAWVGHPYFDVVDNSSDFETKVCRMIQSVCQKLGIDTRDRLQTNARKVKFLLKSPLPPDELFPAGFQDFLVVHDYLQTSAPKMQARLRKRGQKGCSSYTYTVRRPELNGQVVEVKTALTQRDYNNMLAQRDHSHVTVYKTRRCFLLNDQYFQLDIYTEPCNQRCKGLVLLETYSTLSGTELQQRLPTFLTFIREVTGDPRYSMFNLSLKESSGQ